MPSDAQIVKRIIKRYGPVIDLRKDPGVIIDLIRQFQWVADGPDGGAPPGGTPPAPKPAPEPPGPSGMQDRVRLDDIMRALLKVSRDVAKLSAQVATKTAGKR